MILLLDNAPPLLRGLTPHELHTRTSPDVFTRGRRPFFTWFLHTICAILCLRGRIVVD